MHIHLVYHHDFGEISIAFWLDGNEAAFAFGMGLTCEEARQDLRGWFGPESKIAGMRFSYDKTKSFIALMKKLADGRVVKMDPCVNVFKDYPSGESNQITIRRIDF